MLAAFEHDTAALARFETLVVVDVSIIYSLIWVSTQMGKIFNPPKWMVYLNFMENPMNKWDDLGGGFTFFGKHPYTNIWGEVI